MAHSGVDPRSLPSAEEPLTLEEGSLGWRSISNYAQWSGEIRVGSTLWAASGVAQHGSDHWTVLFSRFWIPWTLSSSDEVVAQLLQNQEWVFIFSQNQVDDFCVFLLPGEQNTCAKWKMHVLPRTKTGSFKHIAFFFFSLCWKAHWLYSWGHFVKQNWDNFIHWFSTISPGQNHFLVTIVMLKEQKFVATHFCFLFLNSYNGIRAALRVNWYPPRDFWLS